MPHHHPSAPEPPFILVAVTEPHLAPEASHIAAATAAQTVSVSDPRDIARLSATASAIIIDATTAAHIGTLAPPGAVFLAAADPGPPDYEAAVRAGAQQAFVIPAQSPELLAALGTELRRAGPGARSQHATPVPGRRDGPQQDSALIIAVTGACGGAGASTLAAVLARQLRQRSLAHSTISLLDADPFSGGMDLLLGIESLGGARWPDMHFGAGRIAAADIIAAVPHTVDDIAVLSGARSDIADPALLETATIAAALECFSHAPAPAISIVDLPQAQLLALTPAQRELIDVLIILTVSQLHSCAAAVQLLARLDAAGFSGNCHLVVRHRDWSGLSTADIEQLCNHEVTAELGHIRALAKRTELSGLGADMPRPLRQVAERIIQEAVGL